MNSHKLPVTAMGQTQALLLEFLINSGRVKTKNGENSKRDSRADMEARKEARDGAGSRERVAMGWRDEAKREGEGRASEGDRTTKPDW